MTVLDLHDIHPLSASEMTPGIIDSFRGAINDFCQRSAAICHPIVTWNIIVNILSGRCGGTVWGQFDGDKVLCYCITELKQDSDGKWTTTILHAWSDTSKTIREHVRQIKIVVDDALIKGSDRVQFITRRDEKAWERIFKNLFVKAGTIFETRRPQHGIR